MLVMPSSGGFECGNQRKMSATPPVQKSETPDRSVTAPGISAENCSRVRRKDTARFRASRRGQQGQHEGHDILFMVMMMIAFITISSGLVPLIEGLCAQI